MSATEVIQSGIGIGFYEAIIDYNIAQTKIAG
jgi:hypothetical protein